MNRGTILVVEDDAKLRFIIEKQLADSGFDTINQETGEGALEILERHIPDLVLINILLTGMDAGERRDRRVPRERRPVSANQFPYSPRPTQDIVVVPRT